MRITCAAVVVDTAGLANEANYYIARVLQHGRYNQRMFSDC
jgi:hypothetical protein